jgi:hypothetical protein
MVFGDAACTTGAEGLSLRSEIGVLGPYAQRLRSFAARQVLAA